MSAGHRLVRYDSRGTGLSDRDVTDFSFEAHLGDLEAVLEAVGIDRCAMFGSSDAGMLAVAWAAAHPEQVSHLMLWCSWPSRASVSGTPQTKALRALLDQDWTVYTETVARVLMGWSPGSEAAARRFAQFYRDCTTPEVLRALAPSVYAWDVTKLLPSLECPTLVMQRRDLPTVSPEMARALARGIPNSRLVLLDGRSPAPFLEDVTPVLAAITEFLGDSVPATQSMGSTGGESVTILFTDMEGSTALTQRLGDAAAQTLVHAHNHIVRESLAACGGTEIKHTGDGLMVSFSSATRGIECAMQIQQRVSDYAEKHPQLPFRVKIGMNAGEPVAEGGDFFGTAVQLAARICEMAQPGTIMVSGVVRDLTAGKRFLFADHGETVPRGFEDKVRIFEVRWQPAA
jgi:class 3 adenylate cyclase